jgi:hypothetical protein
MTTSQASLDAGSLYNCINGERQYALVEGDKIISIGGYDKSAPEDAAPGRRWLPVEFEDATGFHLGDCRANLFSDRHHRVSVQRRRALQRAHDIEVH